MSIPLIPINYCTSQISEKLLGLGVSPELSQLVAECLSVRREEVRAQLVRDSCNISHCHLSDYDWKLKVTLASLHFLKSIASFPGSALMKIKLGKTIFSFHVGRAWKSPQSGYYVTLFKKAACMCVYSCVYTDGWKLILVETYIHCSTHAILLLRHVPTTTGRAETCP